MRYLYLGTVDRIAAVIAVFEIHAFALGGKRGIQRDLTGREFVEFADIRRSGFGILVEQRRIAFLGKRLSGRTAAVIEQPPGGNAFLAAGHGRALREQIRVGIRNLVKRLVKPFFGKCHRLMIAAASARIIFASGLNVPNESLPITIPALYKRSKPSRKDASSGTSGIAETVLTAANQSAGIALAEQLGYLASGCRTVKIGGGEFICDDSGSLGIRNIFGIPFAGRIRNGFVQIQRVCA